MSKKPDLVKKICITKAVFMAVFILLAAIYFFILITNQNLRSSIFEDKAYLVSFIVIWLCLLTGFLCVFLDFILMKKNRNMLRDLRDLSFLDKLTGLPNRYSIDRISQKYDSPEKLLHLGCVLMVLDNLKEINEKSGRGSGDKIISDFCSILESVGTQYGLIGRNSGNEFLVVIENCDRTAVDLFLGDLGRRIHNRNALSPENPITLSYSSVLGDSVNADHFYTLITCAYRNFTENPNVLT
ncbi:MULTISPECIES: GGDEF domain-containing protein [unclassified Butyrivibrio]|uniref:GGDEF domain-containing protein n=1 Tax=unclassified Butyrivibrio TaxID=2639466 RepID=UPI0003B4FBED|nr:MULTISPECIES: GGDEF domain-containing protein [unclassified Butyrivibrio]